MSIDLESVNSTKITMAEFYKRYECSLTFQIIHNLKCNHKITEIIDSGDITIDVPFKYARC